MAESIEKYKGYRYPIEIIRYAIWLYHRFTVSLRDVEEMLMCRGITVSYETIREWGIKFGQTYANEIKRKAPQRGDKWHLDEMCIVINKQKQWLWRAVDQNGYELDILLQSRRDKSAAKRFFKKLLKGLCYVPRIIVTDKLQSYGAAKKEILPYAEHCQHKGLNNQAENSHQPTRNQEKQMRKFKSVQHCQRFLSVHGQVYNLFRSWRYKNAANDRRMILTAAFQRWDEIALQTNCA